MDSLNRGKIGACEEVETRDQNTRLRLEVDLRDDKVSHGSGSAGLHGLGAALKVVMKNGGTETIFSGAALSITGMFHNNKKVVVDQPGLQTLADGAYKVLLRDLRDDIGNFTDEDNNAENGIQEPSFDLELR